MRDYQPARANRRGFTILELLTVIAIMAILMALIFPMATTMKERGNQTACMGNLQTIGQALKMYRLDERAYPPALYGFVVDDGNGSLADKEPTTFLYPHYIRSRRDFKCPDNPNREDESLLAGKYQGIAAPNAVPLERTDGQGVGWGTRAMTTSALYYYVFDSYDGGVILPRTRIPSGTVVPVMRWAPNPAQPGYEQHYRRDWYSLFIPQAGRDPLNPLASREMLSRNPEDSTYVTTCTYHRSYRANAAGAWGPQSGMNSVDVVLFLDGHTEKMPSGEVAMGPGILPKQS